MSSSISTLEALIRKETGIESLKGKHFAFLSLLVKDVFGVKAAPVIFYIDSKKQRHLYVMPTNSDVKTEPRKARSISERSYKDKISLANTVLEKMLKTHFFDHIDQYYKIEIVRKFPTRVIKSESLYDKTTD